MGIELLRDIALTALAVNIVVIVIMVICERIHDNG